MTDIPSCRLLFVGAQQQVLALRHPTQPPPCRPDSKAQQGTRRSGAATGSLPHSHGGDLAVGACHAFPGAVTGVASLPAPKQQLAIGEAVPELREQLRHRGRAVGQGGDRKQVGRVGVNASIGRRDGDAATEARVTRQNKNGQVSGRAPGGQRACKAMRVRVGGGWGLGA